MADKSYAKVLSGSVLWRICSVPIFAARPALVEPILSVFLIDEAGFGRYSLRVDSKPAGPLPQGMLTSAGLFMRMLHTEAFA